MSSLPFIRPFRSLFTRVLHILNSLFLLLLHCESCAELLPLCPTLLTLDLCILRVRSTHKMNVQYLCYTVALLVCTQFPGLAWAQSYGNLWNRSAYCVSNLGERGPPITHDLKCRSPDVSQQGSANASRRNLVTRSLTLAALFTFPRPMDRRRTGLSKRRLSCPVAV